MPPGDKKEMLQSISDQLSFWLDKNAATKDVAEKRRCVRQLDILEYDLNLTKIKLPPLQGTDSIGEVAYQIMNHNSRFDVMNFHCDRLAEDTSKLSTEEGLMVFLTTVLQLSGISESEIPVQHYSVRTTMTDDGKEMNEVNAQWKVCGLDVFLKRAELMEKNFKKGLDPESKFFTKDILSKGACNDEKEYLLHDLKQRQILNKFYTASCFLNDLSNMKEPDKEDPINLWYINIHTNQSTGKWLDDNYNLHLANSKYVGAIHK